MRRLGGLVAVVLLATGLVACGGDNEADVSNDWGPAPTEVGGLTVLAQADAEGFRLHTASGDKAFLPGVNLGSTTPLHQPGEIGTIPQEQYAGWIQEMGDLGVRVVRIYTLPPPGFYHELAAYNEAHDREPIYLFQGVYLPDESYIDEPHTLYTPSVDDGFAQELEDISDAVHGDLQRDPRPGMAGGTYTTDVSRWLAGWIIGVEWDPAGVERTDEEDVDQPYERGEYFRAKPGSSPTERWIARHMDNLARMEAERGVSVPIAMANWPAGDPLDHPEEPLPFEDLISVDANHVLPTDRWPAGTFASFHLYPYFPDFQRYEPGIQDEQWNGRGDPYAGYVVRLRDHYAGVMPLLVTEFGVPSSLGTAHFGQLGRDQGAHSEAEAMAMDADMLRLLHATGIGGAFVFAWEDEWFKRTWNTADHQDPERRQLWHDPLTNEQWFGLIATDPDPVQDAAVEAAYDTGPFSYLYVWADASFVHLEATLRDGVPDRLDIGADVVPGPQKHDYRIAVDLTDGDEGTAHLDVRRALDPIRLDTPTRPYRPDQAHAWHRFWLLTNRAFRMNGVDHEMEYHHVGDLVRGTWDPEDDDYDSMSTWDVDEEHDTVRLRIPWSMLGMADPSGRTALGEGIPAELVQVDGIDLDFTVDGTTEPVRFTWPSWNYTTYQQRRKDGIEVVEEALRDLAP